MPNSDDPMGAVLRYVEAFNNGDSTGMAATCAEPMQIFDGMSPHVWQRPTGAEDWWRDVVAEGEHLGASGYRIALDKPRHIEVASESWCKSTGWFAASSSAYGLRNLGDRPARSCR